MLTFSLSVHYYWKWLSFCKICLFLEKCEFLCEGLYTLTKCQILIKKLQFLRICSFVYVLIFIKVFHLLENCYFDSKYQFGQWYFGQECHFPSKIYITLGYKFFGEIEQFFKNCVNLVVNFGKNDSCFQKYFSCQFWKKWQYVLEVLIFSLYVLHW